MKLKKEVYLQGSKREEPWKKRPEQRLGLYSRIEEHR